MHTYTLITGASSGLGRELALIAGREGKNLILIARDKKNLQAVKQSILTQTTQRSPLIEILSIDLSKASAAQKVFDFCQKRQILVNELINNAGFGDYGEFAKSDLNRQLSMIDLNIRALTELTHLFLPAMLKKRSGKIMNVGSVASFLPGPMMSVYFANKAYVLRFSEALAEELKGAGITVTCLCPASTKTGFAKNAQVSKSHSTATTKISAHEVAEFGWYQMQQGSTVAIFGRSNRIMLQLTKLLPRSVIVKLVRKYQ